MGVSLYVYDCHVVLCGTEGGREDGNQGGVANLGLLALGQCPF